MRGKFAAAAVVAATIAMVLPSEAQAQFELTWRTEGYYRTRAVYLTNLAPEPRYTVNHPLYGGPVVVPSIQSTSYVTQRLRLSPSLHVANLAHLYMEIDAFDDVLFGDNIGLSSAPLFAVNPSNTYYLGGLPDGEKPSVEFKRAWIEFQVPVGLLRVGRMPSHWGMGILANGGGSANWDPLAPPGEPRRKVADYYFDEDFGDNHFGSTNDRILFATRPLTILKTIRKEADTSSNVVFAYAFDKLSEAPYLLSEEDRLLRPFGQQGFISRGAKQDDANEHVFVLAYADPDWDRVRYSDELKFGTYWVFRTQDEGFTKPSDGPPHTDCSQAPDPEECVLRDEGSFVWVADFWYRIRYGFWYSEAELVHIGGESTGGVPFPAANQRKEANINSGAFRFGYLTDSWDAILELGYSSGDEDINDRKFKQRPMHPDYNVGLILFEELLRERSARIFGSNFFGTETPEGAKGLMTNGGVVNAKYVFPKVRFRPGFGGFELIGGLLLAWADTWQEPQNVFVCPGGVVADACTLSKFLGWEVDLALKSRFADDHLDFSLETGLAKVGKPFQVTTDSSYTEIPDYDDLSFTLQSRIAFVW